MSKMLSKMNLISVVQQLPKEDIETIQGYVEMIEEENKELNKQIDELNKQLENTINSYTEEHNMRHNSDLELDILKTQQKEFIKWLEDEIKRLKENDIYQPLQKMALETHEHTLQKYKSIIGDDKNDKK